MYYVKDIVKNKKEKRINQADISITIPGEGKDMSDLYNYTKKKVDEQTMIETDSGKRKKEQYVENLREGDVVNDFFAVKLKNAPRPYKRGTWFTLVVLDKTGEITVKYWGGDNKERVKRLYDSFKQGDVIQIRLGNVEIYEDNPEISINENTGGIRRCSTNEYFISDFLPTLEESKIEEFLKKIKDEIKSVENTQLKNLLKSFFDDKKFVEDYKECPSAITHHHNYIGGNIEHSYGVVRLCKNICEMYPKINRDLVVTGAILHDVGKILEYKTSASIDRTDEGYFIGHIVLGEKWIRDKIKSIRDKGEKFDPELETHICHIILSHHGRYEYGSPRLPKTIEASVVHAADLMDSSVKNYIQNIEDGRKASEEEWGYIWDSEAGRKRPFYLGDNY